MIVVRLMGGMGNQMFQYAAARAVAHRLGVELRYDLSYLGRGAIRHFELHHFRCEGRPLGWLEYLRFGSQSGSRLSRRALARATRAILPRNSYEEPGLAFDASVRSLPDDTVISGRFQSYLYFDEISELLRGDFRLSAAISARGRALREQAQGSKSLGVHVRRTDYVNNTAYKDVIQALSIDYYERALTRSRAELGPDIELYVVSDDIKWCQKQPLFRDVQIFVDLSDTATPPIEEFEVLRHCQNFVISNSTFAWWAAWLSAAPDKLVIAPEEWSHVTEFSGQDRLPPNWVAI